MLLLPVSVTTFLDQVSIFCHWDTYDWWISLPLILIQLCSHRIFLKCKPATHNPLETFHSPTVKSISLTFFKPFPDLTQVYLTCLISWYFLPETLLVLLSFISLSSCFYVSSCLYEARELSFPLFIPGNWLSTCYIISVK